MPVKRKKHSEKKTRKKAPASGKAERVAKASPPRGDEKRSRGTRAAGLSGLVEKAKTSESPGAAKGKRGSGAVNSMPNSSSSKSKP